MAPSQTSSSPRAAKLTPHRPWDCAIDLIPDEPVTRGTIYSLPILKQMVMKQYITEALRRLTSTSLRLLLYPVFSLWPRLPITQPHDIKKTVPPSSRPSSHGTASRSPDLQAGPQEWIQPYPDT